MVPSSKKILQDLDALAEADHDVFEQHKATAADPRLPPARRAQAADTARVALESSRVYAALAEDLRAGLIDRRNAAFVEMYRR